MANRWGGKWKQWWIFFSWTPKSPQMVIAAIKLKDTCPLEGKEQGLLPRFVYDKPRQYIKKQRHHFVNKGPYSQGYGFSSSHLWMWELNNKEGWLPMNRYFGTVVLEKHLRVPWTARRSKQSILKEVNPEYSLERLMLKLMLQCFGHLIW